MTETNELKKTRIIIDGKVFDEFTLSLSEDKPDYWTFFYLSKFQGKTLTVESENLGKQQAGFDKIFPDKTFPGKENLYN
ncbi:MAG TPA: hypothetical protein VF700_11195 [Segetibacter sp.]